MHNKIYLIFLSLFISLCTLVTLQGPVAYLSILENRTLEQFPEFTLGAYLRGDYQDSLEKSFGDQFVYRDKIISIERTIEGALMNIFDPVSLEDYDVKVVGDRYLWNDTFYTEFEDSLVPSVKVTMGYLDKIEHNANIINQAVELGVDVYLYHIYFPNDFANHVIHGETVSQYLYIAYKSYLSPEAITYVENTLDLDNYNDYYYNTDHHLSLGGQTYLYDEILASLSTNYNLTPEVTRGDTICIEDRYHIGSMSPFKPTETIKDDLCFYDTIYNDRNAIDIPITYDLNNPYGHNEDYYKGKNFIDDNNYIIDSYDLYFPTYGVSLTYKEFTFNNNINAPNALFFADSNFSAQDIYLMSNFHNGYVIEPSTYAESLTEFITNNDIDILYISLQNQMFKKWVIT